MFIWNCTPVLIVASIKNDKFVVRQLERLHSTWPIERVHSLSADSKMPEQQQHVDITFTPLHEIERAIAHTVEQPTTGKRSPAELDNAWAMPGRRARLYEY